MLDLDLRNIIYSLVNLKIDYYYLQTQFKVSICRNLPYNVWVTGNTILVIQHLNWLLIASPWRLCDFVFTSTVQVLCGQYSTVQLLFPCFGTHIMPVVSKRQDHGQLCPYHAVLSFRCYLSIWYGIKLWEKTAVIALVTDDLGQMLIVKNMLYVAIFFLPGNSELCTLWGRY